MATDSKLFILAAVSKINLPAFSVNEIVAESGVTRQLVHYHLERMVKQEILGLLKRGEGSGLSFYEIKDRELLMDALLGKALEKQTKTITPTYTIKKEAVEAFKLEIDNVRAGQVVTESGILRETYDQDLSDTIDLIKNLRSRLNKPMTRLQAANHIKRNYLESDSKLKEDFYKDLLNRYSTLHVKPELGPQDFNEKQNELTKLLKDSE